MKQKFDFWLHVYPFILAAVFAGVLIWALST